MKRNLPVALFIVFLLSLGTLLAFDHRFLSWWEFRQKPMLGVFVYFPTLCFALLTLFKFGRGWPWSPKAFAAGLLITGLFHQSVIGASHGNPGYMVPFGHLLAPFVSTLTYLAAFVLARWFAPKPQHRGDHG